MKLTVYILNTVLTENCLHYSCTDMNLPALHLYWQKTVCITLVPDMRIVPLGSGGAILDLDWFLNYCDIKLVIHASEIEGKDDLSAYAKHWGYFSFEAASKLRSSQKWGNNSVINAGYYFENEQIYDSHHYGSSFSCYWFQRHASRASNNSHVCLVLTYSFPHYTLTDRKLFFLFFILLREGSVQ
jgi:hypothetical protein